ncbi:thiamine-phosphate kinase [Candidatus Binatia bacterium]|nr:thiamine-phosphate kinase [Candidatus Binatia bacterium]
MSRSRTIGEVGEFGFLARLLPRVPAGAGVLVGPGQDCAVVCCRSATFLFTVDALVEGVHFDWRWMTPRQVGRKAFLVNASDIAAMGGRPRFCVLALGTPARTPIATLEAIQRGLVEAARACGAVVVGGNVARTAEVTLSVALIGEAPRRLVTRAGALPGDRIYVSGTVGDAALAVRELQARPPRRPPPALRRRLVEPQPRLAAGRWLVESGVATAMIDISDGLVQDIGHLCAASRVGAVLHAAALPLSAAYRRVCGTDPTPALCGGEDYELAFAVAPRHARRVDAASARLGCPLTHVGDIVRGRGVDVLDDAGRPLRIEAPGWDHFTGARGRANRGR